MQNDMARLNTIVECTMFEVSTFSHVLKDRSHGGTMRQCTGINGSGGGRHAVVIPIASKCLSVTLKTLVCVEKERQLVDDVSTLLVRLQGGHVQWIRCRRF